MTFIVLKFPDCPYSVLMDGPPAARLASRENRLKLLNFLISECQAAMMNNLENQLEKCSLKTVSILCCQSSSYGMQQFFYFRKLLRLKN